MANELARMARAAERSNRKTHRDGRARRDARRDQRRAELALAAEFSFTVVDEFSFPIERGALDVAR